MHESYVLLVCVGFLLSHSSGMTESADTRPQTPVTDSTSQENVRRQNTLEVLGSNETSLQDYGVLLRHTTQESAWCREQTKMLLSQIQVQQTQLELQQSQLQSQQSLILQLLSMSSTKKNSTSSHPESSESQGAGNDIKHVTETAYVRWGSRKCPNGTATVYSGVAGGGMYTSPGAAINTLCLPLNPVYTNHRVPNVVTYLYGSEYEISPEPQFEDDVLCAVCLTPRTEVLMVPATNVCHTGWTVEYTGFLMAGRDVHSAGTEYICMDVALESRYGSKDNREGHLFYYVVGRCGSLPCPPYDNQNVLSCVVCAKLSN